MWDRRAAGPGPQEFFGAEHTLDEPRKRWRLK